MRDVVRNRRVIAKRSDDTFPFRGTRGPAGCRGPGMTCGGDLSPRCVSWLVPHESDRRNCRPGRTRKVSPTGRDDGPSLRTIEVSPRLGDVKGKSKSWGWRLSGKSD